LYKGERQKKKKRRREGKEGKLLDSPGYAHA